MFYNAVECVRTAHCRTDFENNNCDRPPCSLSHRRPCISDAVYHNQQILSETCARRIVLLKLLTDTKHARPFCDSRATCFIPNMHSMPEPHRNLVIIFRRETLEWWATRRWKSLRICLSVSIECTNVTDR